MKFFMNAAAGSAATFLFAVQASSGMVTFPVVGEYDGSASGNTVDKNAGFYEGNSSGIGDNGSLVIKIDTFRDEIRAAFSNECGGVVSFDNGLIEGGTRTDCFAAGFGEGKTLVVKSIDHIRTDFNATNICVPVSGPGEAPGGGFLAKSVVNGDKIIIRSSFDFTFTEEGFGAGEHVRAVAATILGRNGTIESSRWLMKVKLDNGDVIAQIAELNFRSGNASDDTFFAARAPKGHYITGVAWINLDGNHSGLDSFAFITNGSPKKSAVTPSGGSDTDLPMPGSGATGAENKDDSSGGDSYSLLFGSERK